MTHNDELLDRKQAAIFLKVSDRTLDRISDLPRIRIGERRICFRRSDLTAYLDRRTETRAAA